MLTEPWQEAGVHTDRPGREEVVAETRQQLFSSSQPPMQKHVRLRTLRYPGPRPQNVRRLITLDQQHPGTGTCCGGRGPQAGQTGPENHNVAHTSPSLQALWE